MRELMEFGNRIDLMKRMAERTGVDLGSALSHGQLGGLELRSAALRCASCGSSGECLSWLSTSAERSAEPAPGFCVNGALWDRLAPKAT